MASRKKRAKSADGARKALPWAQDSRFPLHLFPALALCLLTFLAYSNSFHGDFTLDCTRLLRLDHRIQQVTAQNVSEIFHHTYWWPYGETGLYRPLSTLSYMFNYAVLGNGERATGYHWTNFILHVCNVLLVYALSLRLMGSRSRAFAVAALWSVHPVLTESVTYIVGRPELLSGLGVLGGFLLYLAATETTGLRRWTALGGCAAATAIGVFSKESAVAVAGVIAVYELAWRKERRQVRGRFAGWIAVAVPIAAMLYVRLKVLTASPSARFPFLDNPMVSAGFIEGRLTAIGMVARYLWRLACPLTLSADYSYAQIPLFRGTVTGLVSCLAVAVLTVAAIRSYRWNRTAFFFAGFAGMTFLPASNLLFPIGTIMAERFLYLPAIAFCACLVLFCGAVPPAGRLAALVIVCLLVAAYAVRTWVRNRDWSDDMRMAQSLVQSSPNSFKVRKTLAFLLYHADASHANLDEVIAQAERGLAVLDRVPDADNDAEAYRFAGNYYFEKGDLLRQRGGSGKLIVSPESVKAFQRAAVLLNRSVAIMGWGEPDDRCENIGEVAGGLPDLEAGYAYRQLAITWLRLNDAQKACSAAIRAVQADPFNSERYLQMSDVLILTNQLERAAVTLLEGAALTSDDRLSNAALNLVRRSLDPEACALQRGKEGLGLNPRCESVQRLLCPAMESAIGVRIRTQRLDLAQQLREMALHRYGCPAGLLDRGGR
jgi:tetratricopeptide (TPR) repeat protein